MSDTESPRAMVGHGFYNQHSQCQGQAGLDALPVFGAAARAVEWCSPLVIADYGSSQGRNSMRPLNLAIDAIRERGSGEIAVYHTDLPTNDFSALFSALDIDPASYLRGHPAVFAAAIGRSYFQQLLPRDTVSLGWSSFAVHWLSRAPCLLPGAIIATRAIPALREQWAAQAKADWTAFLDSRAREMRRGARLVVLTQRCDENGMAGSEGCIGALQHALDGLLRDGRIAQNEYDRFCLPLFHRSVEEFCAPLRGGFRTAEGDVLELVSSIEGEAPEPFRERYERDGDAALFAADYTAWLRAIIDPQLRASLDPARSDADSVVADFYVALQQRIEAAPRETDIAMFTILLDIQKVSRECGATNPSSRLVLEDEGFSKLERVLENPPLRQER